MNRKQFEQEIEERREEMEQEVEERREELEQAIGERREELRLAIAERTILLTELTEACRLIRMLDADEGVRGSPPQRRISFGELGVWNRIIVLAVFCVLVAGTLTLILVLE